MNEQLNTKLAEWAGFKKVKNHWQQGAIILVELRFTQSLDACFKWLVPKLVSVRLETFIVDPYATRATVYVAGDFKEAWHKDPALALCLAIEKLIDGGR